MINNMQTLKFKTTIKCDGCISKVAPFLNAIKGIDEWNVDLSSSEKILTVKSEGINPGIIAEELKKAGYKAELI